MNILFISTQFPNPSEPNRGVFSLQIVRELASFAGVKVIAPVPTIAPFNFIDSFKRYPTNYVIPAVEQYSGITVYHPKYRALPGMGFVHHLALYRTLKSLVVTIHSDWPIDAVNCHWIFPDGVAVQRICAELQIPVMLTPLGTDLNLFSEYRLRRSAIRDALLKADMISVLSAPMRERCLSMGVDHDKILVIPNGVDVDKFSLRDPVLCRRKLGLPDDVEPILFIGSLVPVKGVSSLLKAYALLRRDQGQGSVKLYILGQGFLGDELKRQACDLEIIGDTVFVGAVAHDALPEWIGAARCLCLPSLSEGHPNVMMEALACGIPVVASAVGSIPDYVTPSTGHLVAAGDHVDLCRKLKLCLSFRYDRREVRRSVEGMTWRNCALTYYRTLEGLKS